MSVIYQSPATANAVLEAIVDHVGPSPTAYRVSVAYVSREGAVTLLEALSDAMGATWEGIQKTLVTCFDFGHTEPAALDYLQEQGFEVRIANLGADGRIRLSPNPSGFHPKIFMARSQGAVRAIVGSANLSRRALSINTEAVSAVELTPDCAETMWAGIVASSVELTDDLLDRYRDIRPAQRDVPPQDEPPVPDFIPMEIVPIFGDVIEDGLLDPVESQAFWLEAGSMRSSASHNQLELPRHANRFFGFEYEQYDDDQREIGYVELIVTATEYVRKLAWHGDNRMERLYLPTHAQAGIDYANRLLLFERSGETFTLTIADADSDRARSWSDESAAAGTLFRVGASSDRSCGLI